MSLINICRSSKGGKMVLFIKHAEIEGPGMFGSFFKDSLYKTKIVELWKGQVLPPLEECDAIILLGGPMNVYEEDKYPFLVQEDIFIKKALAADIPVLGVCLGAQLLAKACGARVMKAEEKEIGWDKVLLTAEAKDDPLFSELPEVLAVFQWHEDTFEIPAGAVLLAEGRKCRIQAVRFTRNSWGLQFHPEMNFQMLKSWLQDSTVSAIREKALSAYFDQQEMYLRQMRMLYLNFNRVIAEKVTKV